MSHPEHGTTCIESARFQLSRTAPCIEGAAPALGRDSQYVLEHILGYGAEHITELVVAGALE